MPIAWRGVAGRLARLAIPLVRRRAVAASLSVAAVGIGRIGRGWGRVAGRAAVPALSRAGGGGLRSPAGRLIRLARLLPRLRRLRRLLRLPLG